MKKWAFLFTVFSVILLLAACSSKTDDSKKTSEAKTAATTPNKGSKSEKASLQLLENANTGKYLADSNGMALYYYTKDQSGISNCSGQCLDNWPAFSAKDFEVPEGFNKSDFGTIKRADNGAEQVTYKGYPLYYWIKDKAKGDVTGQGVGNVWYIVNAQTTFESASANNLQLLEDSKIGKYLADSKGMSLYYYTKDQPGISNCSGQCLDNWPAFSAKDFEVPEGFNKSDFGTIKRADNGAEQVTYKGYPLYYWIKDKAKGDVTGQGVGNVWYIVNAETTFQ
jgi:predicted lipoprotein with Yx(FWY)xxD motif